MHHEEGAMEIKIVFEVQQPISTNLSVTDIIVLLTQTDTDPSCFHNI